MTTTILLVVEYDFMRETLKICLTQTFLQYHIRAVSNESEAIALALTDPPQLIILDVGLSEAKSLDALKRLKAVLPAIPVLVLTSYEDDIYRNQAMGQGASASLSMYTLKDKLEPTVVALLSSAAESEWG